MKKADTFFMGTQGGGSEPSAQRQWRYDNQHTQPPPFYLLPRGGGAGRPMKKANAFFMGTRGGGSEHLTKRQWRYGNQNA